MPSLPSLVRANIFQRKTRAAITIFAVAIEVAAVMLIVGFTTGTVNEVADRVQAVGADLLVQDEDSSAILGFSDVAVNERLVDLLRDVDGVAWAAPVLVQSTADLGGAPTNVWGVDPEVFTSRLQLREGRMLEDGFDLVVDRRLASAGDLGLGQQIDMLGQTWEIVGIVEPGVGARMFVALSTLQEISAFAGKINFAFVDAAGGPDEVDELAARIEAALPGMRAQSLANYREALFQNIELLNQFNAAMSSTAVVLSFLVILLAMYTSIVERTREIGILKALGASKFYIMRAIMFESVLLCAFGAVVGYGLAGVGRSLLLSYYQTLNVEFTVDWFINAGLLGLAGGVLGSFYPAIRAARQDPVRALRYE